MEEEVDVVREQPIVVRTFVGFKEEPHCGHLLERFQPSTFNFTRPVLKHIT